MKRLNLTLAAIIWTLGCIKVEPPKTVYVPAYPKDTKEFKRIVQEATQESIHKTLQKVEENTKTIAEKTAKKTAELISLQIPKTTPPPQTLPSSTPPTKLTNTTQILSSLAKQGKKLLTSKGCVACHSLDGNPRVGPTFKGIWGRKTTVLTNGKERTLTIDAKYIRRSILHPKADVVKGYPPAMVLTAPVSDQDIDAIIAYFKAETKASKPTTGSQNLIAKGQELVHAKACTTCHTLDGSKLVAPSFKNLFGQTITVLTNGKERKVVVDEEYIYRSIKNPNADIVKGYHANMMPPVEVSDNEISAIIAFIKSLKEEKSTHSKMIAKANNLPPITMEEMKKASKIYFNRCAGCHGMLRKGATGPPLLPKRTKQLGISGIESIVNYGLPGGMPAWGKSGYLNANEINLLARFLQHEPPNPPEFSLQDMKKTWHLIVPPEKRPKSPPQNVNWQNYFGVVLRNAGKVAIINGDTKKPVSIINTGFAVHILRSSASGRYFYSIGRDGKVTMIDLWMNPPQKVAEVKVCYDARSVDSSKFKGYEDKYLIVGGYWPPSIVILNGQTLEPLKVASTSSYTYDTNEYLREARAAAIVASHHGPYWIVNIKETGYVWLVDYSSLEKKSLRITAIEAERYLHDGGWDITKRYVLMAANARNTISVIDTKEKKFVANIKVGIKPHPGRGANLIHPKYGPLWLTGHLGDNTIACIGTDPEKHPQYAWKVVKTIQLPGAGGGNLFIKTHPKSKWIWADRPLNPNPQLKRSIFIIDKNTLKVVKTLTVPKEYEGIAVHIEYNKTGDEAWVSVWSPAKKKSAILIFDDKTLKIKHIISGKWLITPTGKFNVYNTMKDIY